MTPADHKAEAERLTRAARADAMAGEKLPHAQTMELLAAAQVHATLATVDDGRGRDPEQPAAATAIASERGGSGAGHLRRPVPLAGSRR